jgi:hypothetical protein
MNIMRVSYKFGGNQSRYVMKDSFVRGTIEAGAKHQHLAFRAGDVWLTILAQMNFNLRRHGQKKDALDKFENLRSSAVLLHSEWMLILRQGISEV